MVHIAPMLGIISGYMYSSHAEEINEIFVIPLSGVFNYKQVIKIISTIDRENRFEVTVEPKVTNDIFYIIS